VRYAVQREEAIAEEKGYELILKILNYSRDILFCLIVADSTGNAEHMVGIFREVTVAMQ